MIKFIDYREKCSNQVAKLDTSAELGVMNQS